MKHGHHNKAFGKPFGRKNPRDLSKGKQGPQPDRQPKEREAHADRPFKEREAQHNRRPQKWSKIRAEQLNRGPRERLQQKTASEHPPTPNASLIWGLHAVAAAWLNPDRRCFRLWLTEAGEKAMADARANAQENLLKRPDPKRLERFELDRLVPPGSVHQGIVLEAAPLHEPSLHDLIGGDNPPDLLVVLDQVTDPHNVGAILRSCSAFGADAVIMTQRNAPGLTGVLAKAASGATEHVPQIHVVNLARVLDELQEAGYWRVGLAEEGAKELSSSDLSGRTVLVLGAEGEGLRQLTRKKCDELAKLPTSGPIGSLNVSNAAAVGLYEARRQKTPFA